MIEQINVICTACFRKLLHTTKKYVHEQYGCYVDVILTVAYK